MAVPVCVIGAGAIGSLFAAHLSRVAEVYVLVRRPDHARALNEYGLQVSGKSNFAAMVKATTDPEALPACEVGFVCTKATQTEQAVSRIGSRFRYGLLVSIANGWGNEAIIARYTSGFVARGVTFMSGTRVSDTHVHYELDQYTWLGPYEQAGTPFRLVQEVASLVEQSGLKVIAMEDVRPAQWSKLIFNAAVSSVSALTGLPHSPHFARTDAFEDLGHLVKAMMDEGKAVAKALGIQLYSDPWEMNEVGAQTNHIPSMLYDIEHGLATEVDFLTGVIAREAERVGVQAPLHAALYRLVKAKEASWTWPRSQTQLKQ